MTSLLCSRRSAAMKGAAVLVVCSVVAFPGSLPVAAQNTPASIEIQKPTEPNPCKSNKADIIYGPVGAFYVGGTVAGMPLKRKGNFPLYWLATRQLRVKGRLALGRTRAEFCFPLPAGEKAPSAGPSYTTSCDRQVDARKPRQCWVEFPYRQINGLSRATRLTGDRSTNRTAYITAASALLTAVLGTSSKAHTKQLLGGITAFGGVLGYFLLIARPERMENYVAVFVARCPSSAEPGPCAANATGSVFPRGDLVMFRIPNYHDYYNISMILSAETGRTFVPETAEKAPK